MNAIIRVIVAIVGVIVWFYKLLFSGAARRSSIRRQTEFETQVRHRLGDLLERPDVVLRGNRTMAHPRPFGYVAVTLTVGPSEIEILDGRGELEVSFSSDTDPGREMIWRDSYQAQVFVNWNRYACLDRCCAYLREHSSDLLAGRRPS